MGLTETRSTSVHSVSISCDMFRDKGTQMLKYRKKLFTPYIKYGFQCTDFHETHTVFSGIAWTHFITNCTQTGQIKNYEGNVIYGLQ